MTPFIFVLVCTGLFAVGLCFLFLMPVVGQTLPSLFGLFMTEQQMAKMNNEPSGTIFIDPNELDIFKE